MAKKMKAKKIAPVVRRNPAKAKLAKVTKPVKRKKKVLAIPKGYHGITPYLIVHNAAEAISFYKKAFNAKELFRMEHPKGTITHAELKIGDAKFMLADEFPQMGAHSAKKIGGSPVCIHLYVKNADATVASAISSGATLTKPVQDMFYGDRNGMLQDPYGHNWCVSTHIEDVSPAQTRKRAAALFNQQ